MNDIDIKRNCGPAFTPRLAQACVPYQCWEQPLSPVEGLKRGSIFPSLLSAGRWDYKKGGVMP